MFEYGHHGHQGHIDQQMLDVAAFLEVFFISSLSCSSNTIFLDSSSNFELLRQLEEAAQSGDQEAMAAFLELRAAGNIGTSWIKGTSPAETKAALDASLAKTKADIDASNARIKADIDARNAQAKADLDASNARIKADHDARVAKIKADTDASNAKARLDLCNAGKTVCMSGCNAVDVGGDIAAGAIDLTSRGVAMTGDAAVRGRGKRFFRCLISFFLSLRLIDVP